MKILNRLTIKHLKMNPKRTIVTIIGIMLSMALMLGCGLLASSFIDEMKQETIQNNGSYHTSFSHLDYDTANVIANHLEIDRSYYYYLLGFADFSDSDNVDKPYYYVVSANQDLLETYDLVEGRLPSNDREIVISEHILYNGGKNYHVGDTISLSMGTRMVDGEVVTDNMPYYDSLQNSFIPSKEQTYTIVGIVSRTYSEDYSAAGYMVFTLAKDYSKTGNNTVYVEYKKPKKTFEITRSIQSSIDFADNSISYNHSLLYFYGTTRYGNVNRSILLVLSFALTLISIGCTIVIYNSFAISTMERKKQFGLYASIGATRKQILHSVFYEAFLVGTIGIFLGILSSFLGIYVVLEILNYLLKSVWSYQFHLVINWLYILVPVLFMVLVVFFSALIPAVRASRVTPIVAIRENDDIKMPKRKLRTPKFILKLFGIEGELALKNMKRNKKKYRITVLSLFVSIVLFISFSTYLNYGLSTINMIDHYDFDIMVSSYDNQLDTLKTIQSDARIDLSYLHRQEHLSFILDDEYFTKEFFDYQDRVYDRVDGKLLNNLSFYIFSDADFQKYTESLQVSSDSVVLINYGSLVQYTNMERWNYEGKLFEKPFSSLQLCNYDEGKNDMVCSNRVDSIVLTDQVPVTFQWVKYASEVTAFISESKYQDLVSQERQDENVAYSLTIQSKEYEALYEELTDTYKKRKISIQSPQIDMKEQKNASMAIKLLLYGFISLVTLIGVTSVFNTIHTSINLRRKEFAILRSIGLTPKGFNKMILFESLFFGLKSLFYGLPFSFLCVLYIHNSMSGFALRNELLIPWTAVILAVIGVFLVVLLAMAYSVNKIKKENILDSIRDENI